MKRLLGAFNDKSVFHSVYESHGVWECTCDYPSNVNQVLHPLTLEKYLVNNESSKAAISCAETKAIIGLAS